MAFTLLLGLLPIVIFVILDSFTSLKTALIGALLLGFLELLLSFYFTQGIDWISIGTFVFLLVLGFISYKMNSPLAFKLQPAVISFLIGVTLLISFFLGKPLLAVYIEKYYTALLEMDSFRVLDEKLGATHIFYLFAKLTLSTAIALFIHALLTLWAAFRLSKWWWLFMKAVAFYLLLFAASFVAILSG